LDIGAPFLNEEECISVEDGTLVFDGCMGPETISGDLVGSGLAVIDAKIDLVTGNGKSKGTETLEACLNGKCGIFEGRSKCDITGGQPSVCKFRRRGISGGVEGVKIKGTAVETGVGTFLLTEVGTIRFPNR
jgi:hypothetical protein